jgi:hypothetical protein
MEKKMKEKIMSILNSLASLNESISSAKEKLEEASKATDTNEEMLKDAREKQIEQDKAAVGSENVNTEDVPGNGYMGGDKKEEEKKEEEGKEDEKKDEAKACDGKEMNHEDYVKEGDKTVESKASETNMDDDGKKEAEDNKEDKAEDKKEGEDKKEDIKEDQKSEACNDGKASGDVAGAEDGKITADTDDRPDDKYNTEALTKGIKVEMEHTNDEKVAKKIAKDHLDEMGDYYDKLEKVEEKEDESKAFTVPMPVGVAAELGLNEAEAAVATNYSTKTMASLIVTITSEISKLREQNKEIEKTIAAEKRYVELMDLGLAFKGDKGGSQKERISEMDEKSFASYKEELLEVKKSAVEGEGFDKNELEKAKAAASSVALEVPLEETNLVKKFSHLK